MRANKDLIKAEKAKFLFHRDRMNLKAQKAIDILKKLKAQV